MIFIMWIPYCGHSHHRPVSIALKCMPASCKQRTSDKLRCGRRTGEGGGGCRLGTHHTVVTKRNDVSCIVDLVLSCQQILVYVPILLGFETCCPGVLTYWYHPRYLTLTRDECLLEAESRVEFDPASKSGYDGVSGSPTLQ